MAQVRFDEESSYLEVIVGRQDWFRHQVIVVNAAYVNVYRLGMVGEPRDLECLLIVLSADGRSVSASAVAGGDRVYNVTYRVLKVEFCLDLLH